MRRLCREPWEKWTREGAMTSVRCTRLDTVGNRGFSGARDVLGADVWRAREASRSLDPDGWLVRRIESRHHNKENRGASEATDLGGASRNTTRKELSKVVEGRGIAS